MSGDVCGRHSWGCSWHRVRGAMKDAPTPMCSVPRGRPAVHPAGPATRGAKAPQDGCLPAEPSELPLSSAVRVRPTRHWPLNLRETPRLPRFRGQGPASASYILGAAQAAAPKAGPRCQNPPGRPGSRPGLQEGAGRCTAYFGEMKLGPPGGCCRGRRPPRQRGQRSAAEVSPRQRRRLPNAPRGSRTGTAPAARGRGCQPSAGRPATPPSPLPVSGNAS